MENLWAGVRILDSFPYVIVDVDVIVVDRGPENDHDHVYGHVYVGRGFS